MKKKLIEVALPLDAINAESGREKSIRHGHPSTLHLWWARRPLAACRAVLFAQLVDDPSAYPDKFPTEEAQDAERQRLFAIIEDLVKWENTTNETVLEAARNEILRSTDGNPPPILDPFAGGGSIPLEAQRLGLEAHASDLNPVAVLINKALIEIPPKWAGNKPVHPDAEQRTTWERAEGLAEDVRRYGQWMRGEAEKRIGHHYPKATLPDGSEANVIAWIWARTVKCPNPACGVEMPLSSSWWLGKKKGKEAWIRPVVEGQSITYEINDDPAGPADPPKIGRGAKFRCVACGDIADDTYIKARGTAGKLSAALTAVAAEGNRRRVYLPPSELHVQASLVEPVATLDTEMPRNPRWFSPPAFGMERYGDLFTNRQLLALTTFCDLVGEARDVVEKDAISAGMPATDSKDYANGVATYLALGVSRTADQLNSLARWSPGRDQSIGLFARHAIPMVWDYPEVNPFAGAAGDLATALGSICRVLEALPAHVVGIAVQADARSVNATGGPVATDPPYYDNIGYADLSDFFYVWLRKALDWSDSELLETIVTPKTAELIATPFRHSGSRAAADEFFETGFVDVFDRVAKVSPPAFPMTLFYAFKQSEEDEGGVASTGWSTMLEGLLSSGWVVTATWPMRTERSARSVSLGTNALASSVVLACRQRPKTAGLTDRQGFVRDLRRELPTALRDLQKSHIAPVDLRQAAIGPGMAVFSRYSKVIEPGGEQMSVRDALVLINQQLSAILDEQESDFDPETRWAIQWFTQHKFAEGPYGMAESLSVSMDVAVSGMVESGILTSGGGRVQLLHWESLPDDWDPTSDSKTPVWEACLHLVKRLLDGGEGGAGELLGQLGGLGEQAQLLAYRLYTICEQDDPALAGPFNGLVQAWAGIQSASGAASPSDEDRQTELWEED